MGSDFHVTILGERGDEWERVCGIREFPVKSPIPIRANLPGIPDATVFLLDLTELDPPILGKIVDHLSVKFSLSLAETEQEIKTAGIPIWGHDCFLTIRNPQKWLDGENDDSWADDPDDWNDESWEDEEDYG